MTDYKLCKTVDRSIIGSIVESKKMLKYYQEIDRLNLSEPLSVSTLLNKIISLKLSEGFPKDQALKAFNCKVERLKIVPEDNIKKTHLYIVK